MPKAARHDKNIPHGYFHSVQRQGRGRNALRRTSHMEHRPCIFIVWTARKLTATSATLPIYASCGMIVAIIT